MTRAIANSSPLESGPSGLTRLGMGIAFCLTIAMGPIAFWFAPPEATGVKMGVPEFSWSRLRDGSWTAAADRYLTAASPVNGWLRGHYHEFQHLAGLASESLSGASQNADRLHFGRAGWLFLEETRSLNLAELRGSRGRRVEFFRQVADEAARLGVRLLVAPAPDKARIYSEFAFEDGVMPAGKRGHYQAMLGEFAEVGIETVDLAELFLAHREKQPEERLYYKRDTHWQMSGGLVAAGAIRSRLAAAASAGTGTALTRQNRLPEGGLSYRFTASQRLIAQRDLAMILGFRSDAFLNMSSEIASWLIAHELKGPVQMPIAATQSSAVVALCGDSFSRSIGPGLPAALGCSVDVSGAIGAQGPIAGLLESLRRLRDGRLRARILVWVFVERSHVAPPLRFPPTLPRSG